VRASRRSSRRSAREDDSVRAEESRVVAEKGAAVARASVPQETLLQIIEAEDERRWDGSEFGKLFEDANASVRGARRSRPGASATRARSAPLGALLYGDRDERVRATAAFALGEIEAESASAALQEALARSKSAELRARAVEALGKIAAALPDARADAKKRIGDAIVNALTAQSRQPKPEPPARAARAHGDTARAKPEERRAHGRALPRVEGRARARGRGQHARAPAREGVARTSARDARDGHGRRRARQRRARARRGRRHGGLRRAGRARPKTRTRACA
jgi:HEAT repeat protein